MAPLCVPILLLQNSWRSNSPAKRSGFGQGLVLQQYTDRFKRLRRTMHKTLSPDVIRRDFEPIILGLVHDTLRRVLERPNDFAAHFRRMAAAIVMKVSYGYDLVENHDPFVQMAEDAAAAFSIVARGGVWIVDALPIRGIILTLRVNSTVVYNRSFPSISPICAKMVPCGPVSQSRRAV
jgi:hypothetical protein